MKEYVNKIVTLDNIKQWEERDSVVKETVSQHSFKVSAICVYLLEKIKEGSLVDESWCWNIFAFNSVKYAILHDFDESVLGRDISHVVKYNVCNGEKIREVLHDFVDYEIERMDLQFINDGVNSDVKTFVKLCDWLAMMTFIVRNKRMGVLDFQKEKFYCLEKINESIENVKRIFEHNFGEYELNLEFLDNIIKDVYGE